MVDKILTAYGTTAGSVHKNPHGPGATNNQDAVQPILVNGKVVGGVICDGCGSMPHSEIGSQFGVKAIADIVANEHAKKKPIQWDEVTKKALEQIKRVARLYKSKAETLEDVIKNYFQFTVIITVVCDDKVIVAACGDGVFVHDDDVWEIEIPIKNSPPYLAYNLIPSRYKAHPDYLDIWHVDSVPLEEIKKSIIIGSDGLSELASASTNDLHHPIFMTDKKRLTLWLQAQVHKQNNVTLHDDISAFIIRPEAVQKKLFQECNELGSLKNQIIRLQRENEEQETEIDDLTSEVTSLTAELRIERAKNLPILSKICSQNPISIHQPVSVKPKSNKFSLFKGNKSKGKGGQNE